MKKRLRAFLLIAISVGLLLCGCGHTELGGLIPYDVPVLVTEGGFNYKEMREIGRTNFAILNDLPKQNHGEIGRTIFTGVVGGVYHVRGKPKYKGMTPVLISGMLWSPESGVCSISSQTVWFRNKSVTILEYLSLDMSREIIYEATIWGNELLDAELLAVEPNESDNCSVLSK